MMDVLEPLFAPLLYPLDPSRRVFVLFLLTSTLMVLIFNAFHRRNSSNNPNNSPITVPLSHIFSKKLWLHPSTWLDIRSLFINSLIKSTLIAPYVVTKMAIVLAVSGFLYKQWGPADIQLGSSESEFHHSALILVFSITLFLCEDFSRFLQHYLMHKIPFLWRIHKVHHQAEVLTPLTLYRIHPLEIALSSWRSAWVLGTITGVFVYAFPGQITALEILGVDAFGFMFNALGANLRHSPFPVSFGRFNHLFISPVMHQIHHSQAPEHHNKNFGSCFSIWDKCFGSFYHTPQAANNEAFNDPTSNRPLSFGCSEKSQHTLKELYIDPIQPKWLASSTLFAKFDRFKKLGVSS